MIKNFNKIYGRKIMYQTTRANVSGSFMDEIMFLQIHKAPVIRTCMHSLLLKLISWNIMSSSIEMELQNFDNYPDSAEVPSQVPATLYGLLEPVKTDVMVHVYIDADNRITFESFEVGNYVNDTKIHSEILFTDHIMNPDAFMNYIAAILSHHMTSIKSYKPQHRQLSGKYPPGWSQI